MAFSEFNDAERQALMKLAYTDLPEEFGRGESLGANVAVLREAGAPEWVIDAINNSENLQRLTLTGYENQNGTTGFKAYAFSDETGDVGFSFCGTEEMEKVVVVDNLDNVAASVSGGSAQTAQAVKFFETYRNPGSDQNWAFGHSKGANLATEVFVSDPDAFGGIQCVNGQPINIFDLSPSQLAALWSEKYDFVVVDGDIVSMFGLTMFPIRYVQNNGERSGFTTPHDLESARLGAGGSYVTEWFPYTDRPLQLLVGVIVKNLVVGTAIAWAVGEVLVAVVEIASKVVENVEAVLREFSDRAIAWLQNKWNATVDVVRAVGNVIREVGSALQRRMEAIGNWLARVTHDAAQAIVASASQLEEAMRLLQSAQRDLKSADDVLNELLVLVPLDQLAHVVWADWRTGRSFRVGACAAYVQQTASSIRSAERSIITMASAVKG